MKQEGFRHTRTHIISTGLIRGREEGGKGDSCACTRPFQTLILQEDSHIHKNRDYIFKKQDLAILVIMKVDFKNIGFLELKL